MSLTNNLHSLSALEYCLSLREQTWFRRGQWVYHRTYLKKDKVTQRNIDVSLKDFIVKDFKFREG